MSSGMVDNIKKQMTIFKKKAWHQTWSSRKIIVKFGVRAIIGLPRRKPSAAVGFSAWWSLAALSADRMGGTENGTSWEESLLTAALINCRLTSIYID
jgi:hypothetical protein